MLDVDLVLRDEDFEDIVFGRTSRTLDAVLLGAVAVIVSRLVEGEDVEVVVLRRTSKELVVGVFRFSKGVFSLAVVLNMGRVSRDEDFEVIVVNRTSKKLVVVVVFRFSESIFSLPLVLGVDMVLRDEDFEVIEVAGWRTSRTLDAVLRGGVSEFGFVGTVEVDDMVVVLLFPKTTMDDIKGNS